MFWAVVVQFAEQLTERQTFKHRDPLEKIFKHLPRLPRSDVSRKNAEKHEKANADACCTSSS